MSRTLKTVRFAVGAVLVASALTVHADTGYERFLREIFDNGVRLTTEVTFPGLISQANATCEPNCPLPPADAVTGRRNFGLTADGTAIDNTLALFQGPSQMVGVGTIVSNTRSCATCHRPDRRDGGGVVIEQLRLGLPHGFPLTSVIPQSDALFTGRLADDSDHPQGFANLNNHGLVAIKPGRFNPLLAWNDPFRQLTFWRKVPRFLNTALTIGFTNDIRARDVQETTRGAIFSHTQLFDERFDDLLRAPNPRYPAGPPDFEERSRNISAFIETFDIEPPALRAFLNPADPALNPNCSSAPGSQCTPADCQRVVGSPSCDLYTVLTKDPFFTVPVQTAAQARGRDLFAHNCMTCHNTPNVFSNVEHVPGSPLNFAPRHGHAFDIGIAQRNRHQLDFRAFVCTTAPTSPPSACATRQLTRLTLPLAREDGTRVNYVVEADPGSAGSTGRYEDLFRFKVPQLRRISELGPYFHDNTAATLEEVVNYFSSDGYNNSADGRKAPISLNSSEKQDLLAFLRIL